VGSEATNGHQWEQRRNHAVCAFFVVLLAVLIAAPTLAFTAVLVGAQPSNGTATTGNNSSTTLVAEGRVVSCSEVRENPTGDPNASYRIVKGDCSIDISNGEILSRVWFKASNEKIEIDARGSGWTIRNVAVTNNSIVNGSIFTLQVNARDDVGLVSNVWVSDSKSNAIFVHPDHAGKIVFNEFTCLRVDEDCAYASRSGNPVNSPVGGIDGQNGIVGFEQTYVKKAGIGPRAGYGLRLGSDGSYIVNSTIVSTTGPAVANTFAGGKHRNQHSNMSDGVSLRDVDIVTDGIGIRLNNHQDDLKGKRQWTSVTTMENVDIEAGTPVQTNKASGKEPIIRGSYDTSGATVAPPSDAPRSPVRAASGVGGGTGSIGGPVSGPRRDLFALLAVIAFAVIALGLLYLLWKIARSLLYVLRKLVD
jgi:hypothetical protein